MHDWRGNKGAAVRSDHNSSGKSADSYRPPRCDDSGGAGPDPGKIYDHAGSKVDPRGVKPDPFFKG